MLVSPPHGIYLGLIKQCDDQLGRLLDHLKATGRMDDTMIVLTSDHGDYLGDHWMGEKDLFHEPSVKVPLIIYDPRSAADGTRGTTCDALVESIDLAQGPDEFHELAKGGGHSAVIDRLYDCLAQWGRRMSQRVTRSDADLLAMRGKSLRRGVLPFLVDGTEVEEELLAGYKGTVKQRFIRD